MTINDIYQFIGGAAIIGIISGVIAKFLADRIIKKDNQTFKKDLQNKIALQDKELEEYKQKLEHGILIKEKYSDIRFRMYNELWSKLVDLKFKADELWEDVSESKLLEFTALLKETKRVIETKRLLLEMVDYMALRRVIKEFENYKIGKSKLIDIDENNYNAVMGGVGGAIGQAFANLLIKQEYERLLNSLSRKFKLNLSMELQ